MENGKYLHGSCLLGGGVGVWGSEAFAGTGVFYVITEFTGSRDVHTINTCKITTEIAIEYKMLERQKIILMKL